MSVPSGGDRAICQRFSAEEIEQIVIKAVADSGANNPRDMGKVVALVKPLVAGRADMGQVSQLIKTKLG